jgi:hypothetical protein
MENQISIKNLAANSATNSATISATAQVFKAVFNSAILATALSLSACGGGGGSGSDTSQVTDGNNSGENRDTTPDSISITPLTDVTTEDFIAFAPVTLSGFDGELTLTVGEGGAFAFARDVIEKPTKDDLKQTALVSAGDEIIFLHNTSEQYETSVTTTATLSAGNTVVYSFSFTSTTEAAADTQAQWSTPFALEDGSAASWPVLMDGAGNKPMMLYGKNNALYTREFDGTSWGAASLFVLNHDPQGQLMWDINSNGKAIMARSDNTVSAATGHKECYLRYYRYDGSNWGGYSNARILANPSDNYFCSNVEDLDIALAGDNSMLMTWRRRDLGNSRYQYCDSNEQCNSQPRNSASSFGNNRRVTAIGLGNGSEGKVLTLNTFDARGAFASEFDTQTGIGSAFNIATYNTTSYVAAMALNDATHSLAVYNEGTDLKARFNNGSGWPLGTKLDQQLRISTLTLQTYLSDGADYGLTLWSVLDSNNNAELHTNLSDAGSFAATSTRHQNGGELVASKFVGDINDNGKAVIAWVGYTFDQATNSAGRGTLYSRFYDGSNWLDTQTVDSDIDVSEFISMKGSLNVYLDNSDDVTLVYSAKKSTQTNNEAQLFYSRRATGNTPNSQARLINSSKEEAEQIKAELEGAGAEVEVK